MYEYNIASKCKQNPKAFWRYINSVRKCKECVSALQDDGEVAT